MLALNESLSPNRDAVAAEVLDGEAIIIDLASGIYYSMDGVGGWAWGLIEAGHSLESIVGAIVERYDTSPEEAQSDLQKLVEELIGKGLVLLSGRETPNPPLPSRLQEPRLPYASPKLITYRDMGDLLALDPGVPGLQDIPWKTADDEPRD